MSSYNFPCPPDYEMKVTEDALALAVSGDTAPSGGLTAGKYIFLTGHSTLPDGGYHVKDTDIGAGETLSASNIEADGEGFANALNAKVSELNSNLANKIKYIDTTITGAINTLDNGVYILEANMPASLPEGSVVITVEVKAATIFASINTTTNKLYLYCMVQKVSAAYSIRVFYYMP